MGYIQPLVVNENSAKLQNCVIKYFIFLKKISNISINRSGKTTVEIATQNRLIFYFKLNVFGKFMCLLEDRRYWYKYITKIIRLIAK